MTKSLAFSPGQALACFLIGQLLRSSRNSRLRRPQMSDLEKLARDLPSWRNARLFDFFVVGSMLCSRSSPSDLDLVLRPKAGQKPTIRQVARMLLSIELYGLYRMNVPVDTAFRTISEEELFERILVGLPFSTIKLHSPKWGRLSTRSPQQVWDIGWGLKEIRRTFEQTSFANKSLAGAIRGRRAPFRYAKRLEKFKSDDQHRSQQSPSKTSQ